MSQQESRFSVSNLAGQLECGICLDDLEVVRTRAIDDAGAAIARQLNGPLTALLLYIGEIKQHSHRPSQSPDDQVYLQTIVEHALQQTERVCALVKRIAGAHQAAPVAAIRKGDFEGRTGCAGESGRAPLTLAADAVKRPLTRREREVLQLIAEGYSNKQGALQMGISPRTFESHRAEAMRKLGARNTAELVRAALLHCV